MAGLGGFSLRRKGLLGRIHIANAKQPDWNLPLTTNTMICVGIHLNALSRNYGEPMVYRFIGSLWFW